MKKLNRSQIITIACITAILVGVISFTCFKNKSGVVINETESYFSDFTVVDGETCITCTLTLENKSKKDVSVSVKAHFTEDYKSGLVSDEYVTGKWSESGEETITIKAGETLSLANINFYSKNNGCEEKSDRLLPELTVVEEK